MIVASNTSPLRYLIAIDRTELIQNLFGHVLIPRAVELELTHLSAPTVVRQWMAQRPSWIEVCDLAAPPELPLIAHLDAGEAEAIQLTIELKADILIMDERSGRDIAAARGIRVIGILGILLESHRRALILSPTDIVSQLRAAGFRISRRLALEFENQIASQKSGGPGAVDG
jgi:predicted nucleic acid-binding protein